MHQPHEYPVPNFSSLQPPERILMGPGPSSIPPSVSRALSKPLLGHLDPEFLRVMDETQTMLRYWFQTKNQLTLPISGTGSAGMEACVVNLVQPGDVFLACVNGVFGGRMADVARRAGARVVVLEKPWGQVFSSAEIREALRSHKPRIVGIIHAETSTGALQPMDEIGPMIAAHDALCILDCVTSLAGVDVRLDEWRIDAAYSGTQKCLSCPPGLAPISLSQRAVEVLTNRKTPVQSWYLDLNMICSYWGSDRVYHHTAPVAMNYALHEALRVACEEGRDARFARHLACHNELREGLTSLGIKYAADPSHLLPQLNAITIPATLDDTKVRRNLLHDYGIEIGGGLGIFKGKAWRIGLMGHSCSHRNVRLVLDALRVAIQGAPLA